MKRFLILVILLLAFAANVFSQSASKSKNPLQAQFDSLTVVNRMYNLSGKIDKLPPLNARLLQLAQKLHNDSTFAQTYNAIANYFSAKGDYSLCLEYNIKAIEAADRGFKRFSALLRANVAGVYANLGNYQMALQYALNSERYMIYDTLINKAIIPATVAGAYSNLNKPDSALKYIQLALQGNTVLSNRNIKDPLFKIRINQTKAGIYHNFARIYEMLHEPELVNYYYRKVINFCDSINFQRSASGTAINYGKYLMKQKNYDEARNYGTKGFNIARRDHFKASVIEASGLLYDLYKRQSNKDSAYYYLEINHLYQDSLVAEQKANQLQGLIINQQLKDAELQAKAAQDKEQRQRNIEYAIIAFGLVVLMMLFLLLSRSIIVNTRVIEVVGVIGLLILFEFINLVIHPYLAEFTNDSPLLMLLLLVAIAAIIVPMHHRLEHWVKHKLVEKNKTIRLEAAKRTIEQLGGKSQKSEV